MADIWILAADRARARLFSLDADASCMTEIADFVNPAARAPGHAREHAPPPRVHDRIGEGRHAIEAHTAPREKAALQFAAMLGLHLKHAHDEQRYGKLVVIAPAGFLGMVKAALGTRLGGAVVLGIAKNVTRDSTDEIRKALPRTLLRRRMTMAG